MTAAAAACATPALALDLQFGVGVQSHRLREEARDGTTLVRESGTSPVLRAGLAQPIDAAWTARAALETWAGRAGYDGRTQSGAPTVSRTDTQSVSVEAGIQWQPRAAPGLVLDAGLDLERFRRHIRGAGLASGLDERMTQLRWQLGVGFERAASVRLGLTWGGRGPLTVSFDRNLYDTARLRSGRAVGWVLDASLPLARRWRLGANVEVLHVGRSREAALTRGGSVVGTVAQPQWRRERMQVTVAHAWGS